MQQQPHGNSEDGEKNMSTHTATIEILDGPHQQAVRLAISNILNTEIAETTYAQIVDGLPLIDVVRDVYGDLLGMIIPFAPTPNSAPGFSRPPASSAPALTWEPYDSIPRYQPTLSLSLLRSERSALTDGSS